MRKLIDVTQAGAIEDVQRGLGLSGKEFVYRTISTSKEASGLESAFKQSGYTFEVSVTRVDLYDETQMRTEVALRKYIISKIVK